MRSVRLPVLAVAAVFLAGCAARPVVTPTTAGRAPDPQVLSQWVAKGRIALAAQGEGGSGSFVWQQRSERTELAFRGPFGAGGLQLVTDGETFELQDGDGRVLDGDAARAALQQRLGIELPLGDLRYWMLGLPGQGQAAGAATSLPAGSADGSGFQQREWEVRYQEFRPVSGWSLPTKLSATTAGIKVRIVVDDWQVPAP